MNHLTGCNPILVLDVFEHASIIDYGLNLVGYINNFFKNVKVGRDGKAPENRL